MSSMKIANTRTFHGHLDTDLVFQPGRVVETKETKYFVIQERELSYRFYLHQHPYVQQLVQRLLRKGTNGFRRPILSTTRGSSSQTQRHQGIRLAIRSNLQSAR